MYHMIMTSNLSAPGSTLQARATRSWAHERGLVSALFILHGRTLLLCWLTLDCRSLRCCFRFGFGIFPPSKVTSWTRHIRRKPCQGFRIKSQGSAEASIQNHGFAKFSGYGSRVYGHARCMFARSLDSTLTSSTPVRLQAMSATSTVIEDGAVNSLKSIFQYSDTTLCFSSTGKIWESAFLYGS